ncbi:hypothetical protein HGM15179_016230 [Zosterops borbonicus]|uniref:Uncharacterized protein n=1 Tax=Zosterops borbonicus TaxID=364589 RepID=A0A8K1G341_9PASS|nr:hypothetical protein HGM15179_016230 [Zosterops borbonicus]
MDLEELIHLVSCSAPALPRAPYFEGCLSTWEVFRLHAKTRTYKMMQLGRVEAQNDTAINMIPFCLFIHHRGPGDSCEEGEMQQWRSWDDNNTSTSPGKAGDGTGTTERGKMKTSSATYSRVSSKKQTVGKKEDNQPETMSSCSVSCCLEKETNPQLSTTTLQKVIESDKVTSESPFLQAKKPQLPQSSFIWLVFQDPHQPCCPPLDAFKHLNVLPKLRGTELDTALKVWPHQC